VCETRVGFRGMIVVHVKRGFESPRTPKLLYMKWRRMYNQDYVSYWNNKGDYGEIRVKRMLRRKKKRYEKMLEKKKSNARRYGGSWLDNGKRWQYCEWPEGSICEYPCNGDC
jgi:hypothetical protein